MALVKITDTFSNLDGTPLSGATLQVTNRDTMTLAPLYTDSTGTTATANPCNITGGSVNVYVHEGSYDLYAIIAGVTASTPQPFEALLASSASSVVKSTQQAGSTYIFEINDEGTVVEGTSASAQTFTIPPNSVVPFPKGTVIEVFQDGAGQITIAGDTGVTIHSNGIRTKTAGQYATIRLRQRAIDEWVLSGDLA